MSKKQKQSYYVARDPATGRFVSPAEALRKQKTIVVDVIKR